MASATVTKTTLHSQAWENLFNLINTRTVVADPREPKNIVSRDFVYRTHPHPGNRKTILNFTPYVVVNSPRIRHTQRSVDGTLKDMNWESVVEVVSSGSSKWAAGKGRTDLDTVNDDLLGLNNQTNQNTMRNFGLKFLKSELVDSSMISEHGEDLFVSEFEITFRNAVRMT